jgi:hypothetical protein
MDHKVVTVCLMNSRRIHQILDELADARNINNDSHMAIVATLKLMNPDYQGIGTEDIADDLKGKSRQELFKLARSIHPVLCSLKLEKWLGVSGQCHYLAQSAAPRGGEVRRMLLDGSAREIRSSEALLSPLM